MNNTQESRCGGGQSSQAPSVSQWLDELKDGEEESAARHLWRRYAPRMARIAQKRILGIRCSAADEEDIVAEAFSQFVGRVRQGGFSQLADRRDLWQILVSLTDRRAIDHLRRESRRGKRIRVVGESHLSPDGIGSHRSSRRSRNGIACVPDKQESQDLAAEFREWLQQLDDDILRKIVLARMQGYTNQELAEQLQISLRSVERKLARIRDICVRRMEP